MKLPSMKISLWRPATLLLVWILSLACSLVPGLAEPKTPPVATPSQPTDTAPGQVTEAAQPTDISASPAEATTIPATDTATAGPYTLAISDRYSYFEKIVTVGQSLAAKPGQLWIGTISGTIEEVDSQSGTFGKSISLTPENGAGSPGGMPTVYPIYKMAFEGGYLWAFAGMFEDDLAPPGLFAINSETGEVVRQWDLNSPEWMQGYERGYTTEDFGVSPGKIWIDGHIVDTQTFETQLVSMPGDALFAYDGKEWMWMNGELGGACDDLILVNVNEPTKEWCEDDWPFFTHEASGIHPVGMGSPMVFAGDKVWMAGDSILEAYPADINQGMKATGPLVSIPFIDNAASIKLFSAEGTLWVLDTLGDQKLGYLFQLDSRTGETINSLDLIGDEGRAAGDVPMGIAAEGGNLWVLTGRQLLRIKLP